MKSLKPTDHLEIEIPHFNNPGFKPWLAMAMSILSLVISVLTWLKAQDDSQAKAAYEAQAKAVKELSDEMQDMHREIDVLRGYSEGQAKSLTVAVPVKPGASAIPSASFDVRVPMRIVPFKDVKPDEWNSTVPGTHPAPKPVTVPNFADLGKPATK